MATIYRDNLEVDFAPWTGRRYTVRQLYELVTMLLKGRPQKYLSLVVISRGTVNFFPLAARPMTLTMSRMRAMMAGLRNATGAGLVIPDSMFLMNVWDEGRCYRTDGAAADPRVGAGGGAGRRLAIQDVVDGAAAVLRSTRSGASIGGRSAVAGGSSGGSAATVAAALAQRRRAAAAPACTVPLFSLIKSWDYEARRSEETDVLLPFFNHVYGTLVYYPWDKKHNKALMRAAMQAQMRPNSTRLWIIQLQKNNPDGQRLLDAGITNNLSKRKDIQLANFVSIPDHARWKYLLSADGFTASCRLGKLMGTNSVVLKEATPWIEYYYRSLRPNNHFIPFTKDNVLEVLKSLDGDTYRCREVATAAQTFVYTYLGNFSKALYVRRAISIYNSLFDDMDSFMRDLSSVAVPSAIASGGGAAGLGGGGASGPGLTLLGLVEHMKAYVERLGTGGGGAG